MWVPGPSGPAGGCAVSRWRSCASGAVHRGTRGGTVFVKFMSPKYDKAGFQRLVIVGIPPILVGRRDSNRYPFDPQSSALPNCATARTVRKAPKKRIYHMTSITQNKRVATRVIPDYHLAIGRHQLHRRHGPSKLIQVHLRIPLQCGASRPTPDTPIMDTSAG